MAGRKLLDKPQWPKLTESWVSHAPVGSAAQGGAVPAEAPVSPPAGGIAQRGAMAPAVAHVPIPGRSTEQQSDPSYENYILSGDAAFSKVLDGGTTVPSNVVLNTLATTGSAQLGQLFTVQTDGPIELTNYPTSGPAIGLDVPAGNYANGVFVQTYKCNAGKNQEWTFIGNTIRPSASRDYCLDVQAFGTADNTPIQLYTCNGGTNQAWSLFQLT